MHRFEVAPSAPGGSTGVNIGDTGVPCCFEAG